MLVSLYPEVEVDEALILIHTVPGLPGPADWVQAKVCYS